MKFPLESRIYVAEHVMIGPYQVGNEVKNRIGTYTEVTSDTRPDDPSVKMHLGMYYHCNDVFNPEVGDIRIQFSYAGLQGEHHTVIGKLVNGKIEPFISKVGKKVLIVKKGEISLTDCFKQEHRFQRIHTWAIRFVGFIFIFFFISCLSKVLTIIFLANPLTQRLAPNQANPVSSNFTFALSISLLITSIAWIVHRPWLGVSLLGTALSPIFFRRPVFRYHRVD